MEIAITGGTGMVGSAVAAELRGRGHAVRLLSRTAPRALPAGTSHRAVDLAAASPDVLARALDGIDAVVDAANARDRRRLEPVLVAGSRRLAQAAARAGAGHHVLASIAGVERVPFAYYRAKVAQEAALADAPLPVTVVRTTQFHELVAAVLEAGARRHVLPAGRAPLQPVAGRDAARAIADVVEAGPGRGRLDVGGPQVLTLGALAATWRRVRGARALAVPLPLAVAGPAARALLHGALLAPDADLRGALTFERWAAAA